MVVTANPARGRVDEGCPVPSVRSDRPLEWLATCPGDRETALCARPDLAAELRLRAVHVKDERAGLRPVALTEYAAAMGHADDAALRIEGWLVVMEEVITRLPRPPSHVLLQGDAALAAASAAMTRREWGDAPWIVRVTRAADGCAMAQAGLERAGLARDVDWFVTADDALALLGSDPARAALRIDADARVLVVIGD